MYFRAVVNRFRYTVGGIDLSLRQEEWGCISSIEYYEETISQVGLHAELSVQEAHEIRDQVAADEAEKAAKRDNPDVVLAGWAEKAY